MKGVTEFECKCGHVEPLPVRWEVLQNYNGRAVFVCPGCGKGQDCVVLPKQFLEGEDTNPESN